MNPNSRAIVAMLAACLVVGCGSSIDTVGYCEKAMTCCEELQKALDCEAALECKDYRDNQLDCWEDYNEHYMDLLIDGDREECFPYDTRGSFPPDLI